MEMPVELMKIDNLGLGIRKKQRIKSDRAAVCVSLHCPKSATSEKTYIWTSSPLFPSSKKGLGTGQQYKILRGWLAHRNKLWGKLMGWPTSESCKLYEPLPSIDILPLYLQISLAHEIRGQPRTTQCMQIANITPGRLQITKEDLYLDSSLLVLS